MPSNKFSKNRNNNENVDEIYLKDSLNEAEKKILSINDDILNTQKNIEMLSNSIEDYDVVVSYLRYFFFVLLLISLLVIILINAFVNIESYFIFIISFIIFSSVLFLANKYSAKKEVRKIKKKTESLKFLENTLTKKIPVKLEELHKFIPNLIEKVEIEYTNKQKTYQYLITYKKILSNFGLKMDLRLIDHLNDLNFIENSKDFYDIIDKQIEIEYNIPKPILNLMYKLYHKKNTSHDFINVIHNEKILERFLELLIQMPLFLNRIESIDTLKQIIITLDKFDLDEILMKTDAILIIDDILEDIFQIIKLTHIRESRPKINENVLLSLFNSDSKYDIVMKTFSEVVNNLIKYEKSPKKIEKSIIEFYLATDTIRFKKPDFFKKFILEFEKEENFFKILFLCLSRFPTLSDLISEYHKQDSCFASFIREKTNGEIESYWITHFRQNLLQGKILIDIDQLAYEHMKKIEDKADILDYIFARGDVMNYTYLYKAILSKQVPSLVFLKILSLKKEFTPFLLTFTSGISKTVNDTLKKLDDDFPDSLEWVQYTPTARIGLFTNQFLTLKDFKSKFEKVFTFLFYQGITDEKMKILKDRMSIAEKTVHQDLIKSNYMIIANSFKQLLSEIRKRLKIKEIPFDQLRQLRAIIKRYSSTGLDLTNAIEDVMKKTSIFFHELSGTEKGIEKIEVIERYSPIEKLKLIFLDRIDLPTSTAALSFTQEFDSLNFYQIFENFLKIASFEDILTTDDDLPEFKTIREKIDDSKKENPESNFLDLTFGKEGVKIFMQKMKDYQFHDYNLYELGLTMKIVLDIKIGTSPEFFRINKDIIDKKISRFKVALIEWWKSKIEEYNAEKKNISNEIKNLEKKLNLMSNRIINHVLYILLVITPGLKIKDFSSCKETYEQVKNYLEDKLGVQLKQRLAKDKTLEFFLIKTVQLIETLREIPISIEWRKSDYNQLKDEKLEVYVQNRIYSHFVRFFQGSFHREPQVQRVRFDFIIGNIPVEVKLIKNAYKKEFDDFVNANLKQISDYCIRKNAELGFLFIYDNRKNDKVIPYDVNNIHLYEGVIDDPRSGYKKPKIIIIRIPNYFIPSSDKK